MSLPPGEFPKDPRPPQQRLPGAHRSPASAAPPVNAIDEWQDRQEATRQSILERLLQAVIALGLVNLLLWVGRVVSGLEPWSTLIVDGAAVLIIVALYFGRSLGYRVRAFVLLALFGAYSAYLLVLVGPNIGTILVLSAMGILGTILIGIRTGTVLLAASVLMLFAAGLTAGNAALPDAVETIILFITVNVTIQFSLGALLNSFEMNLAQQDSLARRLADDRRQLESRTEALERREVQIRTAAEIVRVVNRLADPQTTLERAVELMVTRFDLYYAGVFLVDDKGRTAVLKAASGEPGRELLDAKHSLRVGGTSMVGWCIANRKPRIALDVGKDAVRFDNPYLPLTRSELALPLVSGEQALGALSIQSTRAAAFDQNDITVMQGIADNLAIALANAQLFAEAQGRLQEVQSLHRQYLAGAWSGFIQDPTSRHTAETTVERSKEPTGLPGSKASTEGEENASTVLQPLILRDQVIGQIELEVDPQAWRESDHTLVAAVASQAAQALENARLLEESQRTAAHEHLIADISGKVWAAAGGTTGIEAILSTTLAELGRALQASEGHIRLDVPGE